MDQETIKKRIEELLKELAGLYLQKTPEPITKDKLNPFLQKILDMSDGEVNKLVANKMFPDTSFDGLDIPNYTSDLRDDFVTHKKAVEWGQGLGNNYFNNLESLLSYRDNYEPSDPPSLYSMCSYQCGDFSRAALTTILDYEDWAEKHPHKEKTNG